MICFFVCQYEILKIVILFRINIIIFKKIENYNPDSLYDNLSNNYKYIFEYKHS